MDNSPKILYETNDSVKQNLDSNLQKYFRISKHYLDLDPLAMKDPDNIVKESYRFFRYTFPPNLSEHFFRFEESPLLWICDSPLNNYIKDFYRHHFPVFNGVDQYKTIKELYIKWITNKQITEKKYFALSIVNFIDNYNSRSNFLSNILGGIVYSFDKSLYSPQKSVELFSNSKEIIGKIKLSEDSKTELEYLITLFSGYAYLVQEENGTAKEKFEEALKLKPYGITAKFHKTLMDIRLNDIDTVENSLKEIFEYDVERINFAMENLSVNLFGYFIENAVFNNIFYYPEFAVISDKIESLLSLIRISNEQVIKLLTNKFEVFKIVTEEKSFPDEITRNISFIEKLLKKFGDSDNIHFLNAGERLKNKFLETVIKIKEEIKNKHYSSINETVSLSNEEIKVKSANIELLKQELEIKKNELKIKLSAGITKIENKIAQEIQKLEEEIKNLPFKAKLNPQTAFKHAMTYNVILSFMVFLMGGCAGYSNNYVHSISELKDLISVSLTTGIKWGVITFLIGIILSGMSAVFTLLERSSRRQQLIQNISVLKNGKEHKINFFKKEMANKEEILVKNFEEPIKANKERIEQLISERNSRESTLKAEADKQIEEECKPYSFILDEEIPDAEV
ncbi:MAG: hypothetical protein WAM24_02540 [Ignavibacteriaceae bacterium]